MLFSTIIGDKYLIHECDFVLIFFSVAVSLHERSHNMNIKFLLELV